MNRVDLPSWICALEENELVLLKQFVLNSGSLKAIAELYDVTYPTIRLRLDRLIDRIRQSDEREESAFEALVKDLTLKEDIKPGAARKLLEAYEKEQKRKTGSLER